MIPVRWEPFLELLDEGSTIESECWLDPATGRIEELAEDVPKGDRVQLWGAGTLSERDHLVVFAREEPSLRCELEATYFGLRELALGEDAKQVRRERREAHRAALARAPRAKETLEGWSTWHWKHSLTAWAAHVGAEPPPFAEEALGGWSHVGAEHAAYESQLFVRLQRWLDAHAPSLASELRPGASAEDCAAAEARLPHALPEAVRKLFAWHDGSEQGLFFEATLLSLEEAIADRALFLEVSRREGWPKSRWSESWLPLFGRANSDRPLVVDLATGVLFEFENRHDATPRPVYPDFVAWLETYVGALELGVVKFEGGAWSLGESWDRWLHHDRLRFGGVRRALREEHGG